MAGNKRNGLTAEKRAFNTTLKLTTIQRLQVVSSMKNVDINDIIEDALDKYLPPSEDVKKVLQYAKETLELADL